MNRSLTLSSRSRAAALLAVSLGALCASTTLTFAQAQQGTTSDAPGASRQIVVEDAKTEAGVNGKILVLPPPDANVASVSDNSASANAAAVKSAKDSLAADEKPAATAAPPAKPAQALSGEPAKADNAAKPVGIANETAPRRKDVSAATTKLGETDLAAPKKRVKRARYYEETYIEYWPRYRSHVYYVERPYRAERPYYRYYAPPYYYR